MSKVGECDEPDNLAELPTFMEIMQTGVTIKADLTADLTAIAFPTGVADGTTCGNVRILFVLTDSQKSTIYDTTSLQIIVACPSSRDVGYVNLSVTYGYSNIPTVQVGDRNPFGSDSAVRVDYVNCARPKSMACLYCGFDDDKVGVDDNTWARWQTKEVKP